MLRPPPKAEEDTEECPAPRGGFKPTEHAGGAISIARDDGADCEVRREAGEDEHQGVEHGGARRRVVSRVDSQSVVGADT